MKRRVAISLVIFLGRLWSYQMQMTTVLQKTRKMEKSLATVTPSLKTTVSHGPAQSRCPRRRVPGSMLRPILRGARVRPERGPTGFRKHKRVAT